MATEEEIQSFLSSPLVRWTTSLLPGGDDLSWQLLAKGVTLATLLEGLDASFQIAVDSDPIDTAARARNILLILKSIKYFYKEILGQLLLISLPAPRDLSQIPPSTNSLASMETLLLLVLGVAVQSEQKQEVIITIKNLPLETQHEIVDRIRAITDNPNLVLSRELSNPEGLAEDQRDQMYCLLIEHAKRLVYERDELSEDLSSTRLELDSRITVEGSESTPVTTASNHALVEVAESKAKLRKLRQQLEEKTEQLQECREELEKISDTTAKLKAENLELCQDARAAKTYRDELDMVRERAEKVEKLEAEIMRYKDKMNDIEFFKSRVEELREDNRILVETKEMLEEQLGSSRKRCEAVLGLENDIIKFKGDIERLHQERDTDRNRIKELIEENSTLSFSHKTSMSESQSLLAEMDALKGVQGKELNILSEQLGKDAVSRVHRLELENKHLKQELENYRSVFSKKEREVVSEMEQEMRKSTMTVSRLEEQAKKDSQIILDAQQELTKVQQEHRSVEATLETLNEQYKLLQIERDTEVDALSKQVNSLSARAASSETQQLVSLQEENRKLVAERTVLQTQVSKSNLEKDRFTRNLEQLKDKVSTLENTEQIKNKLERETQHLSQELEKYTGIQEQYDNMTEQLNSLNLKIREQTERQEELQTENMKLRVENQKLNRRVESIRNENQSIADIEQEKDGLKQTIGQLRTTITTLQKGQTKQDELELKMMTSTNENTKLQRQLDTLNRKFEEQSLENTEIETENKKMQKTIETLKVTVRRVNQLETENLDLEGKTHKVERENKSLIREIERLKQAVEVKDLSLDNSSAKLAQIERELEKVRQEKDSTELNEAKIQELEASNADLSSQCLADKKALLDLREELVKEKMAADQLVSKLEQVNQQLKVIGDAKEEEHETTEVVVKERVQMLRGENRVSVLQAERDQLSSELARLRVAAVGSEDKEVAWSKQVSGLQEDLVNLSKEKAGLQVENRTLQSQSSSLLDQINNLQAEYSRLEMDLTKATKQEKDREVETTQLLADQTRLQSLHNQLQQDYDRLRDEREELKTNERILRSEISKLRERIAGFTQGQDDILRAKEALDLERETLNMDKKTLSNLRSEHSRLKDDFRSLFTANERMKTEYCNLQTDYKTLKTENNQLKLKNTKLAGQLGDGREQMTILDVENSKVNNRCEVLHQLNLSLEEDRKSLMSQVSLLLYQYHDLLTQTLDDKEHFHEEEREYSDKMNNLRRQKEKLEEKIMEQYKKMDNTTPKKKGIGLTLVKRMKKAGSNMFLNSPGRNRRIEEDTSSLGSGGNESIDSESRSPSEAMLTSGGDLHSGDKLLFRRSLPASMMGIGLDEEEEKEEEDNQSIVSYFSGLGYDQDHIPTRDTGLDRDLFRDNREYDYPEFNTKDDASSVLGLSTRDALTPSRDPLTPSRDLSSTPTSVRKSSETQPRSISRVYLSAGSDVIGGRGSRAGEEPRLTSWKKTGDTDLSLPPLPARRPQTPPPSRPPKPRGSNPPTDDEESKKDSTSESSVWYEYGCV